MSLSLLRITGYAVVAGAFLAIGYGLTTLFVVLDFFGIEGAAASVVTDYLHTNASALNLSLLSVMIGYLLSVPVMLAITQAAFGSQTDRPFRRHFAFGLVWASLPLRPIWWSMLITMMPMLLAVSRPGTDPTIATATFVNYQTLGAVFNTITEDIAINIFGGTWFVLVGLTIVATRSLPRILGWLGILIGVFYLVSSSELFGFSFGNGGGLVAMIASISGPFWLGAAGFLSIRKIL
jgi:hypothetical protein